MSIALEANLYVRQSRKTTLTHIFEGKEIVKYKARQVLLQTGFQMPNNSSFHPSPFMRPEEIARDAIEQGTLEKLIQEFAERNKIKLPQDFTV